jgi:hypothetical protein
MRQTPAAQAQVAQAGKPAAVAGNSGGAAAKAPAVAASAAGAGAAASGPGGGGRGGIASPARPGQRVSAQTSILAAQDQPPERWYRRIAPRYIALIVAGVLVVGAGGTVGVMQLMKKDASPSSGGQGAAAPDASPSESKPAAEPVRPGDVTVAVLNATTANGLAKNFSDKAKDFGFKVDDASVGNYTGGQRAESVVMYAAGKKREARLVRTKFRISAIEPVDDVAKQAAPRAEVVVVIGVDQSGG